MIRPPTFVSEQEYVSRRGDVGFWWLSLAEVLERHGLSDARQESEAGTGPTYPTFLYGDVVVKFFGYRHWWREGLAAERAAHAVLATDPEIAAPRILAEGWLYEDDASWPYLITSRMPGVAWHKAGLTADQQLSVAAELGKQVQRVHALPPSGHCEARGLAGLECSRGRSAK